MQSMRIISRNQYEWHALRTMPSNYCYIGDYFEKDSPKLKGYTWGQARDKMSEELEHVLKESLEYPLTIELHCHYSFAFLAGVKLRQRLMNDSIDIFNANVTLVNATDSKFSLLGKKKVADLSISGCKIDDSKTQSDDIALVLEIGKGKEALSTVRAYINQKNIVSEIIYCKYDGEIDNGQFLTIHDELVKATSRAKTVHLFGFSPVQLFFTLGAQWRHTKSVQLYEYMNNTYQPSFQV